MPTYRTIIVLGATGDLAERLLLPGLASLVGLGRAPRLQLIGAAGSDWSDDDWRDGLEGYLLNVVRMARVVTPHLVEAGGGTIVNISTSSPFEPNPRYPVSATFRAGLASFVKLYTDEYGPAGIRMNNVLPGWNVDDPAAVAPSWTERIPLRRAGSREEIARVVRFLAGDGSSYVTGQNIRVDGGIARSV